MFEWRGPSPFHFVRVLDDVSKEIKAEASFISYGWGVIPIHGEIGNTTFTTSLIPKDGCYLIPIKDAVRKAENLERYQEVEVRFNLGKLSS